MKCVGVVGLGIVCSLLTFSLFPSAAQALVVFNNQLVQLADVIHRTPVMVEASAEPMLQELEGLVKRLDAKKMPKNLQEYESHQEYSNFFYDYARLINSFLQRFFNDDLFEKYIVLGGALADITPWQRGYSENRSQQISEKISAKKRWSKTQFKDTVIRVGELAAPLKQHLQEATKLRNSQKVESLMEYEVSLNNLVLFLENWILAQQFLFQSQALATHENFLMGDFVVQVIIGTYFEETNVFHLHNPFAVIKSVIDNKGDLKKVDSKFINDYPLNTLMVKNIRNIVTRQEIPMMDKAHCDIIKSWNKRVPCFGNISDMPPCAPA